MIKWHSEANKFWRVYRILIISKEFAYFKYLFKKNNSRVLVYLIIFMNLYFAISSYIIIVQFSGGLQMFCLKSKTSALNTANLMEDSFDFFVKSLLHTTVIWGIKYKKWESVSDAKSETHLVQLIQSWNRYPNTIVN